MRGVTVRDQAVGLQRDRGNRRRWSVWAAACVVGVMAVSACGSSGGKAPAGGNTGSEAPKVTNLDFSLDFLYDGLHAPFFAAKDQGFYSDHGLNVKIIQGSGSSKTLQRVASGQVPIGLVDATTYVAAMGEHKLDVTAIGVLLRHSSESIGVASSFGANDPSGLAGATMADSSGSGSSGEQKLQHFLQSNGISGKVKIKEVAPGAGNGLMYAGKVDASYNYAQTFVDAPIGLNILPFYKYGLDFYGTSILANTTWLKSHAELAKEFMAATADGFKFVLENPSEAGKYVGEAAQRDAKYFTDELAILKDYWSLPLNTAFGAMDEEGWQKIVTFLNANQPSLQIPSTASLFTTAELPSAG